MIDRQSVLSLGSVARTTEAGVAYPVMVDLGNTQLERGQGTPHVFRLESAGRLGCIYSIASLTSTNASARVSRCSQSLRLTSASRDLRSTGSFIAALIKREPLGEGLPPDTLGPDMEEVVYAKTADRSVLGCMNEMACMCEIAIGDSRSLRHTDLGALKSISSSQHQ